MNDTRFVEYLIIGSHTASWLLLLIGAVFGIPISSFGNVNASLIVIALPFIYLIGMLFDSLAAYLLERFRRQIRSKIFDHENYKDELIAFESPSLYDAYEARIRRVRVIGAAIFNWPLFGISLLLNLRLTSSTQIFFISVGSSAMCIFSILAWRILYKRAYQFRKNACDIIREKDTLNLREF